MGNGAHPPCPRGAHVQLRVPGPPETTRPQSLAFCVVRTGWKLRPRDTSLPARGR